MNDPPHWCLYPHVSQHTLWVSVRHQWFLTKCQNGTPWEWERASLAHWDITVSILFLHVRAKGRQEDNTSKREAEKREMEEISWREWSDTWERNTISASALRVKGSKSKENGERVIICRGWTCTIRWLLQCFPYTIRFECRPCGCIAFWRPNKTASMQRRVDGKMTAPALSLFLSESPTNAQSRSLKVKNNRCFPPAVPAAFLPHAVIIND